MYANKIIFIKLKPKMTTEVALHLSNEHTQSKTNPMAHQGIVSPLDEANIKFPLQDSWSFWFYKNEKTKSWKENVKFLITVDFVEDFWSVYNHLQLVSRLNVGCDYMLFKVIS